jgi:thiol-disulfide isomerase/thioredoxin
MWRPAARVFSSACLGWACLGWACLMTTGCQRQSDAIATLPAESPAADAGNNDAATRAAAEDAVGGEPLLEGPIVGLELLDYDGIEQLIASHRGKVVVMDAWAMSCPPCVQEFPKLVALSHQFSKDQLACISLSFDYEGIGQPTEKMRRVIDFLGLQQATFDNVLASEESDTMYRKFHLASVPAVFVYDKTGALRRRFDNQKAKSAAEHFTYEDVGRLVEQLVAEPAPEGEPISPEGSPTNEPAPAGSAERAP